MLRASTPSLLCAAVLAFTTAACGQSGSAGEGDPAALVPANAVFYLEAAVQPQGERREDALAAAGKIMRTDDPAGKLRALIDKELAEQGDGLAWERDFASWLGEDAGVWATNLEADEPSFAVILASKDAEAAKAALARLEKTADSTYTARSYDGIDYSVDDEGMAHGVVDDFVVIATEAAFKRTADTRDGEKLIDSNRYEDAIGNLEDDRLGHYFVDLARLIDAAMKRDPEGARSFGQLESLLPVAKLGPVTGSLQADGDGIALDTVVTGLPEGPFRKLAELWSGGGTELLGDLPGDAWGAFVSPRLGESAESLFGSFAGALGGAAVAGQLEQSTGLDLQQDLFSWIGDVGVFVRGTNMTSLDGALVISATDEGKAETAFGKLVGLVGKQAGTAPEPAKIDGADAAFAIAVPDAEKQLILARGQGRVVAAYGAPAANAALSPDARLGDGEGFGAAEDILGDDIEPTLLLSVADVIRLAAAVGATDAEFDKARPYLESLGVVTSGGKGDGDRMQSRVAVTLR